MGGVWYGTQMVSCPLWPSPGPYMSPSCNIEFTILAVQELWSFVKLTELWVRLLEVWLVSLADRDTMAAASS